MLNDISSSNDDDGAMIKTILRMEHPFSTFVGAKMNLFDDLQHAIAFITSCEDVLNKKI